MPMGIENSKAVFKFNLLDLLAEFCIATGLKAGQKYLAAWVAVNLFTGLG